MIKIGKYNELVVLKNTPTGLLLGNEEEVKETILMPNRYVPDKIAIGEQLKVFVYLDADNHPVATTFNPYATVGEFAFLRVKEMNQYGAFMDWGIDKDVFMPYSEQVREMQLENKYICYLYIDKRSGRITASSKWEQFIDTDTKPLVNGTTVHLLIAKQTDIGYKAIINNQYEGLLYKNELFEPLKVGELKQGFIKQVRDDGKIDLTLQQQGYNHIKDTKHELLERLKLSNGILPLGDKSSPEEIYQQLKISKKAFKKTIGGLFKDRLIIIGDFEIKLLVNKE